MTIHGHIIHGHIDQCAHLSTSKMGGEGWAGGGRDGKRRVRLDAPRAAGKVPGVCKLVMEKDLMSSFTSKCVSASHKQVRVCCDYERRGAVGQEGVV